MQRTYKFALVIRVYALTRGFCSGVKIALPLDSSMAILLKLKRQASRLPLAHTTFPNMVPLPLVCRLRASILQLIPLATRSCLICLSQVTLLNMLLLLMLRTAYLAVLGDTGVEGTPAGLPSALAVMDMEGTQHRSEPCGWVLVRKGSGAFSERSLAVYWKAREARRPRVRK